MTYSEALDMCSNNTFVVQFLSLTNNVGVIRLVKSVWKLHKQIALWVAIVLFAVLENVQESQFQSEWACLDIMSEVRWSTLALFDTDWTAPLSLPVIVWKRRKWKWKSCMIEWPEVAFLLPVLGQAHFSGSYPIERTVPYIAERLSHRNKHVFLVGCFSRGQELKTLILL